MISIIWEFYYASYESQWLTPYILVVGYFWFVWGTKIIYKAFYKPTENQFTTDVSIIMPSYNEDRQTLATAIDLVLKQPASLVKEFIIVIDYREQGINSWLIRNIRSDPRLKIIETQVAGKRNSLALGIREARCPIVISVESDVFLNENSIKEVIKPFSDSMVGGVIGDQRVFESDKSIVNWINSIAEGIKYNITYPALSVRDKVTVLSGRCVAYRREAVLPLLRGLTKEYFFGRLCVSGDDGRMTSLLIENGWKTKYQSSSIIETLSPPTLRDLMQQRLRWHRNTARRTLRALFWDRLWVWRHPMAAWHMLLNWTNVFMMFVMSYLVIRSIFTAHWFWFGTDFIMVLARLSILVVGITATRFLRTLPVLQYESKSKWIFVAYLPVYGLLLWGVNLTAILTMNRQGWVTRSSGAGAGGFGTKKT